MNKRRVYIWVGNYMLCNVWYPAVFGKSIGRRKY